MPKTTHPRETETRLYRLAPVESMLDRDEWAASTIKEACWVKAASEQKARILVEVETRARQSHSATKLPFFSPWSSSTFTSCTEEGRDAPFHNDLPVGLVVTSRGPVTSAVHSAEAGA